MRLRTCCQERERETNAGSIGYIEYVSVLGRRLKDINLFLKVTIIVNLGPGGAKHHLFSSLSAGNFALNPLGPFSHLLQQYPSFEKLYHSDSECSSDNDFVLESVFNWSFCGVPKNIFTSMAYAIRLLEHIPGILTQKDINKCSRVHVGND